MAAKLADLIQGRDVKAKKNRGMKHPPVFKLFKP
jgi:hypothetical protein